MLESNIMNAFKLGIIPNSEFSFLPELSSEIIQYYSAISDTVSQRLQQDLWFNWSSCKYWKIEQLSVK